MLTATQRAEHMAQQVLISARLHNSMVVTADLVDAVMGRDVGTEQGKADVATVRRIIRKRAGAEGVRVILTETERYWAIREQLHGLHKDQVDDLADSIAAGGDDDPRGWDAELIKALSVRRSGRIPPERLWGCEPVSVRLWSEPRSAEEEWPTAAEAQRLAGNEVIAGRARAALALRHIGEAQQGVAGVRFHVDARAVLLYAVDYRGWSTPVLLEYFGGALEESGWTTMRGISVRGSYLRLLPPVEEVPAPAERTWAEVLGADPIPAGEPVLTTMPGRPVTVEALGTGPETVLAHEEYVVQLRSNGRWVLPNHDDPAVLSRSVVARVRRRMLEGAPGRSGASLDVDGTVYLSDGRQAARYIPTGLLSGLQPGVCPGCSTAYADNGDGPCPTEARPA
ncbi:hypothetical protein ACGFR8_31030 [Streptomyces brevispora]|uniref:hypothetical protein n=1 Tax=Streptomyces brevispora TaxID=887462 RepID=UPI00371896BF